MSETLASNDTLAGLRVVVVDDEGDIRHGLQRLISSLGATVSAASDGVEALAIVERDGADLVLTDLMMPNKSGAELLADVKERSPSTVVVVLTGYGTVKSAVSCLQQGAAHFMTKPFDNQDVLTLVTRLGRQALAGRAALPTSVAGREVVAEDPAMRRVMQLVDRVASNPMPVLIQGESGTGKEVVARAIHDRSEVRARPFLAVNAAALPDSLLESELFGHTRGSFTGADKDRPGIFQLARGGSVFLDELSSMSPSFQGKLLRVLQEKIVRPLGASRDVQVDFRLIAATNRNLESMSRSGEFREDLFYRVSVMRIQLPPLRERPGDIVPLALLFLRHAVDTCLGSDVPTPEISEGALDALRRHSWPGNVRELENAMVRAVVVCPGDRIHAHHLGLRPSSWGVEDDSPDTGYAEGKRRAIEEFQREFVQRALERTGGNVSRAAGRCGMTRAALQRILRQLEIDTAAFRAP
jgi:DNA-binding NtrC family response regulator